MTKGERRFFHWRDSAAARSLMDLPQTPEILNSLAGYDVIYLSAITLSLYGGEGRARLFAALRARARSGARFAFDTNFRARGWPDLDVARAVFQEAFAAPISCWPPPRICCRSIPAKALKPCWRGFRAPRWC